MTTMKNSEEIHFHNLLKAEVAVPLREEGQRGGALLATTGALAPQRSADRPAKRREFKEPNFIQYS